MVVIDKENLQKNLLEISKFGALEGGGITRLAFSKEEKMARKYLLKIVHDMQMSIKEDAIGNIYAFLQGDNPSLTPVISGSHLDSVPNGGYYDGTLGVLCALESIRAIKKSNHSFKRSIGLVVFSCEESSRFNLATVGSKLISSKLCVEELKNIKDKNNISIYDAAKEFGCDIDNTENIHMPKNSFYSYIELHIEQGPVLERKNIPIGLVLAIASPIRYKLVLQGNADHSGATPMNMRKDALTCASEIILAIEKITSKEKTTVGTVGYANAKPGVLNVIPGFVEMGIDIRDIDKEALLSVDTAIKNKIETITSRREISYHLEQLSKDFPVLMDEKIISTLEKEAQKVKLPYLKLPSGAGHDAMNMIGIATHTGMIFIPCKDGISHNTKEEINIDDAYKATLVLANSMLTLANEE